MKHFRRYSPRKQPLIGVLRKKCSEDTQQISGQHSCRSVISIIFGRVWTNTAAERKSVRDSGKNMGFYSLHHLKNIEGILFVYSTGTPKNIIRTTRETIKCACHIIFKSSVVFDTSWKKLLKGGHEFHWHLIFQEIRTEFGF